MTNDKRYNGWTNYETWCVSVWLSNDEGTQLYWEEMAYETLKTHDSVGKAVDYLADCMKSEIADKRP